MNSPRFAAFAYWVIKSHIDQNNKLNKARPQSVAVDVWNKCKRIRERVDLAFFIFFSFLKLSSHALKFGEGSSPFPWNGGGAGYAI